MSVRSTSTLLAGLLLILVGALFLMVNFTQFAISWVVFLKIVLPALFVFAGTRKLIRHYTWSEEELLQKPGSAGLLSGIFWLSLGIVILLDIFNLVDALGFIGFYWPVLLIVFGLGKIADYYRLTSRMQIRTGEIFGVVFVVVFGLASSQLSRAHFPLLEELRWDLPWPEGLETSGERFRFELEDEIPSEGLLAVEIENLYGDVQVKSGDAENVKIQLVKVVLGDAREEALEIAEQVLIVTTPEDGILRVATNRSDLGERGRKLSTHLTLTIPETLPVSIKNKFGRVLMTDRLATCSVQNSYGKVELNSIEGSLDITNRYKGVEVKNIKGKVSVTNHRGFIDVSEVEGDLDLKTEHDRLVVEDVQGQVTLQNSYGRLQVEDVSGPLHIDSTGCRVSASKVSDKVFIKSSHKLVSVRDLEGGLELESAYANVNISRIAGPVELRAAHCEVTANELEAGITIQGRGSQVSLKEISGDTSIQTSLRNVSVAEFSGALSVQNEFGEVSLKIDEQPAASITVKNANGEITLEVPERSNFKLTAQAVAGEIISDFGPEPEESEGNVAFLRTTVGEGGPQIELQTTNKRIRIKKQS